MVEDLVGIGKGLKATEKATRELRAVAKAFSLPIAKALGELIAGKIKRRQLQNAAKVLKKAQDQIGREIELSDINLKVGVPLLNNASLEEDEDLQAKWAGLLVSTIIGDSVLASYPHILSMLTPVEAKILDGLFEKQAAYQIEDPSTCVTVSSDAIRQVFNLSSEKFRACAENLKQLGLLESVSANPYTWQDLSNPVPVLTFAEVRLTFLGVSFVRACKGPTSTATETTTKTKTKQKKKGA